MGIINWARSRFNGRTENRGIDLGVEAQERCQGVPEEKHFTDEQQWPHQAGLLSIGTFGNDDEPRLPEDHRASTHDMPEFTIEEVKKLQDDLGMLLRRARSKKSSSRRSEAAADSLGQPLDRFLNCPSSLEVDRRVHSKRVEEGDVVVGENGDLSPNTKIILTKARDLLNSNNSGAGIKNKSFKFLLKKMFVCHGGFAPAPSLKDPVKSRMDKFFRTVLSTKINLQPSNASATRNCLLEDRPKPKTRDDHRHHEEEEKEEQDSCRWDRTDAEFIVLEI